MEKQAEQGKGGRACTPGTLLATGNTANVDVIVKRLYMARLPARARRSTPKLFIMRCFGDWLHPKHFISENKCNQKGSFIAYSIVRPVLNTKDSAGSQTTE